MGAASTRDKESVPRQSDRTGATPLMAPQAIGRPGPEYAQPLVPAWLIALGIALLIAVLADHSSGHSQQPRRLAAPAAPHTALSLCGPDWRVQRLGDGYRAATVRATNTPCALHFGPGPRSLSVHVGSAAAFLGLGPGLHYLMPMPAGSWWQVLIDPRGETLSVQPALGGDIMTIAIQPTMR